MLAAHARRIVSENNRSGETAIVKLSVAAFSLSGFTAPSMRVSPAFFVLKTYLSGVLTFNRELTEATVNAAECRYSTSVICGLRHLSL